MKANPGEGVPRREVPPQTRRAHTFPSASAAAAAAAAATCILQTRNCGGDPVISSFVCFS